MVKRFSVTLDPGTIKGIYTTGSTVTGYVTVEVDKPKYYEKITVHLSGQGRVHWSSASRNSIEKKESEDYMSAYSKLSGRGSVHITALSQPEHTPSHFSSDSHFAVHSHITHALQLYRTI